MKLKEEIRGLKNEIMDEVGGMLQGMKEVQDKLLFALIGMQSLTNICLFIFGDSSNVT